MVEKGCKKIGGIRKICVVASNYTYATEKIHDKKRLICHCVSLAPPLLNPGSAPDCIQSGGILGLTVISHLSVIQ